MRVLIINTLWKGASTGKIAMGLYHKLIEHGHQAILVYGDGRIRAEDENVKSIDTHYEIEFHRYINKILGYHGTFAPNAMRRLKDIFEDFRPDIVQLYNLHGHYIDIYGLFAYLKKNHYATVYGMLDEHPYLGYCCYSYECNQFKTGCKNCSSIERSGYIGSWFFNRARKTFLMKEKAYSNFDNLIFTGPEWVIKRARESLLLRDKHLEILDEFIDTDIVFTPKETTEFRKKLEISSDSIVILNVAPSRDNRKGVHFYIELAKMFEGQKYVFINVGYSGATDTLPSNYLPIQYISNQDELALYYSMADLLVCTSIADTMPNVCLDALACGTPVCGFNITGIPYVADYPLGKFAAVGDLEALYHIVSNVSEKNQTTIEMCRRYAKQRYSPETYYNNTMRIYRMLCTR